MWIIRLFQLMTGVPGVFLLVLAIRNSWKGFGSKRWPSAEGRVLSSSVLVRKDSDGISFTPQVEYEYSVGGATYRGKRLRYGQTTGAWNRSHAEITIAPFQPGRAAEVFFDPRKPANAVLIAGTAGGNFGIAAAGAAFVITALLLEQHAK